MWAHKKIEFCDRTEPQNSVICRMCLMRRERNEAYFFSFAIFIKHIGVWKENLSGRSYFLKEKSTIFPSKKTSPL